MNKEILFRGKRIDNGEWVEGYYVYDYGHNQHLILKNELVCPNCINDGRKDFSLNDYAVDPSTLCQYVGKKYMDGELAFEGDIFESQIGGQIMVLRYGTYQAYCPADREYMDSVGFYAECNDYPDMPIGCLEDYALKVGNVFDNPELLELEVEHE